MAALEGRNDGSTQASLTELDDVEKRLSELQDVIRSQGTSIPPYAYMQICDSLRDLEQAVSVLRRSSS